VDQRRLQQGQGGPPARSLGQRDGRLCCKAAAKRLFRARSRCDRPGAGPGLTSGADPRTGPGPRTGMTRPVQPTDLRELALLYLDPPRGDHLSRASYERALAWARWHVTPRIALLQAATGERPPRFRAFDHIVEHADRQAGPGRRSRPPPGSSCSNGRRRRRRHGSASSPTPAASTTPRTPRGYKRAPPGTRAWRRGRPSSWRRWAEGAPIPIGEFRAPPPAISGRILPSRPGAGLSRRRRSSRRGRAPRRS
jgi:hypothetical protein